DLHARIRQWVAREPDEKESADSARSERPNLAANYETPKTKTEEAVAAIWQDVLGIKQVGTNDNFAELGGHSLLAIKIVAELRNAFRVDLPVRALFDTPTVAGLSAYIDAQKTNPQQAVAPVCAASNGSTKANELLTQLRQQHVEGEDAFIVPQW